LFSLLATLVPLAAVPYVMFGTASFTLFALAKTISDRLASIGCGPLLAALAVTAALLQPQAGEVFFSLTNTQWILGLTLAVYVCIPGPDPSWFGRVALLIVSLTGPFSAMLAPVLAVQWLLSRDWQQRKWTYVIVVGGGLVQLLVMLTSHRISSPVSVDQHWGRALLTFVSFGGRNTVATMAAGWFWGVFATGALISLCGERRLHWIFLVAAAAMFYAASLYSLSLWSNVDSASPIGGGSRYFFIPYALLILAAFVVSARRTWATTATATSLAVLCIASFQPDIRYDFQWPAFVRLASFEPNVSLPINPQWDSEPTWVVVPSPTRLEAPPKSAVIDLVGQGKTIHFSSAQLCPASTIIALRAQVSRAEGGRADLRWQQNGLLPRYYPAGDVVMHFAVTKKPDQTEFEFDPAIGGRVAKVQGLTLFCID
jgi:hypothetical protein